MRKFPPFSEFIVLSYWFSALKQSNALFTTHLCIVPVIARDNVPKQSLIEPDAIFSFPCSSLNAHGSMLELKKRILNRGLLKIPIFSLQGL